MVSVQYNQNLHNVVIGIVMAEVLRKLGADKVRVKWPNDLYLQDRKLAGIWPAVLAIAACVVVVSLLNLFRVGGESMTQILSCLSLFLSGFGFLYGAVRLSGVAPSKRAVRERQFKNLALDVARTEA